MITRNGKIVKQVENFWVVRYGEGVTEIENIRAQDFNIKSAPEVGKEVELYYHRNNYGGIWKAREISVRNPLCFTELKVNDVFTTDAVMYKDLKGKTLIKTAWNKASILLVNKESVSLDNEFVFHASASVKCVNEILNTLLKL